MLCCWSSITSAEMLFTADGYLSTYNSLLLGDYMFVFQVNDSILLDSVITSHFKLIESAQKLHHHEDFEVIDIYSHEIITNPQENLRKVCSFLGVASDEEYIAAASKLLYTQPSKTRHSVVWTREQRARVTNEMKQYKFMKPFTFESLWIVTSVTGFYLPRHAGAKLPPNWPQPRSTASEPDVFSISMLSLAHIFRRA